MSYTLLNKYFYSGGNYTGNYYNAAYYSVIGGGSGGATPPAGVPANTWKQLTNAQKAAWERLTEAEQEILMQNPSAMRPFFLNAAAATLKVKSLFPKTHTGDNNNANAFKHCYFSALNTLDLGFPLAKQLGNAHEEWTGNPSLSMDIDLHNNQRE